MKSSILAFFTAVFFLPFAAAASTVTLTFGAVPNLGILCTPATSTYVESGFNVSGCPRTFGSPGKIHLDDGGTPFGNSASFSTSSRFDVNSLQLTSGGVNNPVADGAGGFVNTAYNNVLFQGFRAGSVVASGLYSTGLVAGTIFDVIFGSLFSNLDLFTVTQVLPVGGATFCAPCGHVDLDNVTLTTPSPVPLPASLPLLLAGFAGLMVVGRKNFRIGRKIT